MISILALIYIVSLALNLVWEFAHARLYTVWEIMPRAALNRLLVWQSFKDALWISLAYAASDLIYQVTGMPVLFSMALILLAFAYVVERHALWAKRWEYLPSMPMVLGVGLTPFVELAVTGLIAVSLVHGILGT